LKKALDVETELVAGSGGVFEITVDGAKLFSKKALGRFPLDGEVLALIRAH
jgi:selT/selW/selH-like putative selenoprotein